MESGEKKRHSTSNVSAMSNNLEKPSNQKRSPRRKTIQNHKQVPLLLNLNEIKSNSYVLSLDLLSKKYDYYETPKFSNKAIGPIKSYSYNTYQGLYRDYNEDKISINSLLKKPANSKLKTWPKISYFAIFDGHGGETCSEFLEENFLKYLTENKNFPYDIKQSLIEAFEKAENEFFKIFCKNSEQVSDYSGSCALVAIIFDNKIYLANIGDSRAIMSINGGTKVKQLTLDHKPNNIKEFERAIKNGSKVYLDDNDDFDRDVSKIEFIKEKNDGKNLRKKRKKL
jgi:hypothetical protein